MVVALNDKTIYLVDKGGELVPTTTKGRLALLQCVRRDTIPFELQDIYFPRIVKAGYKLAIKNV